jgi:hypothetical protein
MLLSAQKFKRSSFRFFSVSSSPKEQRILIVGGGLAGCALAKGLANSSTSKVTCLVWFGLVWFGLVWFGLVWFGLVWFVCCLYLSLSAHADA